MTKETSPWVSRWDAVSLDKSVRKAGYRVVGVKVLRQQRLLLKKLGKLLLERSFSEIYGYR